MKKGIDISTWQDTNDDFVRAKKSGIEFVILRAGFGREASQIDNAFEVNYKKAVQAGLPVGVYWYSYADSAEDAKREAAACMAVIKNKKLSLPVFFDIEEQSQFARGRAFCSSLVRAFCGELQKGGYRAGLYISYSPFVDYIEDDIKEKYPVWIAQYWERCQYDKAAIWQYTDKGRVDGFDDDLDMNILYDEGLISGSKADSDKKDPEPCPDITYQVHTAGGSWLPNVKNTSDYAGLENRPIDGIRASVSRGHIRYRVRLIGGTWLPWVTDREDYAGIYGRQIDCVQMELTGAEGYTVQYRVSTAKSTGYLEWVKHYNNLNVDGYAGLRGVAVDKLQCRIVKK